MYRNIEKWSVQKILNLLWENKLNYKPNIQRQFVYNPSQQQQVIMSIKKGFIASALVVEMTSPNTYILLDGKQRINSIIGFINGAFDIDQFYFSDNYRVSRINKTDRYICPEITNKQISENDNCDSAILLKYEFPVVIYSDMTKNEELTLFNVINTTGEKLNTWELINGRYPTGLLLDMRANYFNEILQTNTTTLNTNNICVKKFEKYFGTHEVNRGELYIKIIEKLYAIYGGDLDDQPYEVIDGIKINTKNYNRLCKFIEEHSTEKFEKFAQPLIKKLNIFYDLFKDISNLGALKEACFNISDYQIFNDNKNEFENKKDILAYLITQYNDSDIKNGNNHEEYFQKNILPLCLLINTDFRNTLDSKRFYKTADKERIFFASQTYNKSTNQVECKGVYNDKITECGCGKKLSQKEATIDHIIPWILGGKTTDENAQILCRECNSKKGAKIIADLLSK